MARLANMVYLEKPIKAYKDAAKSNAKDGYKTVVQAVGGPTPLLVFEARTRRGGGTQGGERSYRLR